MLHSIKNLIGFTIGATDGEIGKVKDFYFDSQTWKVRYLVVETGDWLVGRKVLLSPVALQNPDWDQKVFPVNLSMDQVKHSPDIDTEQPVSRQQEADLHSHYAWPFNTEGGVGFMTTGMVGGVVSPDVPFEERIHEEMRNHDNDTVSDRGPENEYHTGSNEPASSHSSLRSFKDFNDFTIKATDGDLGEADDLLIDSSNWTIPFVVIETGNWYSGKKVLASTSAINFKSESSDVYIDQTTDFFRNSPEFDDSQPIDQEHESTLYSYYQNR